MAATQTQQPPLALSEPLPLQFPVQPAYTSQVPLTPPDSDSSSPRETSSSPRSIHSALPAHLQQLQTKQLRTPRSPMYVPAVLRPTEKPVKSSPPKRGGLTTTTDSNDGTQEEDDTSSVTRIYTGEWNDTRLGDTTGPPSRNHWKVSPYFPIYPSFSLSTRCLAQVDDLTSALFGVEGFGEGRAGG